MQRRQFIARAAGVLSAALLPMHYALAHTPYAQWNIFRKRHLQILTSRADLAGDEVGDAWVEILHDKLPLSRAMVSRAHNMTRIAALLKTDQSKLAVLSYTHAQQMFKGADQFEEYGQMPLEVLVDDGKYLLVTRSDLPLHHGFLIVATLMGEANKLNLLDPGTGRFGMSLHAGARAYQSGEKLEMPTES
ncbi:MAG: hypothetical protein WBJ21_10210 [Burkholderiaceae bacterium]|jgi:hypothetical protein